MPRSLPVVMCLLLACGCEGRQVPLPHAGPKAAFAAQQSDSSRITTRRVLDKADYQLGLSPDGARVAYTEWDSGNVVLRDIATGEVRNLTHNPEPYKPGFGMHPRISRDGRWVAYAWSPGQETGAQLRVVGVDGTSPRIVYDVKTATSVYPEDWSPDGSTLLSVRTQEDGSTQIVLIPVDAGAVRVLKTFDWRQPMRMNFSPDGRFVAYDFPAVEESNLHRDVFVLDLASGEEHRLVKHDANDYLLGWGPDERHVLFASDRAGTLGAWLQEVENGRARGEPVLVKPDLWNATIGQFTANGAFFYGVQTVNREVHLGTLDPKSGKLLGVITSLTPSPMGRVGDPQWSPDGRSMSYVTQSRAFTSSSITIRSLESSREREIPVPHELKYSYHRWGADSKSLILSGSPKGRYGLFRMDLQTGKLAPIFMLDRQSVFPGGRTFEIAPDGRDAVYLKNFMPTGKQAVLDLDVRDLRSQTERVLYRPQQPEIGLSIPLSPDGRIVAFVEGYEHAKLMLQSLQGGPPIQAKSAFVPRGNSPLAWSADGRALFAVPGQEGDEVHDAIWRVPLDGSAATPTGIAKEAITEMRIDPSGRRIVFAAGNAAGELWVMEHILPSALKTAQSRRN